MLPIFFINLSSSVVTKYSSDVSIEVGAVPYSQMAAQWSLHIYWQTIVRICMAGLCLLLQMYMHCTFHVNSFHLSIQVQFHAVFVLKVDFNNKYI